MWKDDDKTEEQSGSSEDAPKDSEIEHKEECKQDLPSDSGDHPGVTA